MLRFSVLLYSTLAPCLLLAAEQCNCRKTKEPDSRPLRGGIAYFSTLNPTTDKTKIGFPAECPNNIPVCQGEAEELRTSSAVHIQVQSFSLGRPQNRPIQDLENLPIGSGGDMSARIPELVIFQPGSARPSASAFVVKLHPRGGQNVVRWEAKEFRSKTGAQYLSDLAYLLAYSGDRGALLPMLWETNASDYYFLLWSDKYFKGSLCFLELVEGGAEIHVNNQVLFQRSNEIRIARRSLTKGRWRVCIYRNPTVPLMAGPEKGEVGQTAQKPYYEFEIEVR